ncbi:Hypothetical predicted protein [Mytilus galloprovincialis]|uniref:Uncharacterized protein n=1 Tax=Mytilus galloprovincialis TaxID=29158 RepID=A0A8B6BF30_MYTGA|nr:Hypothetical predicted protein [Mytilus galloprovincialis]
MLSSGTHLRNLVEVDIDSGDPDTDNRDIEIPDYTDSLPEYLGTIMDSTGDNITSHQKQEVARLLMEFKHIFAKNDEDLGCFSGIQHQIMTGEARPIRQPLRCTPLGFQGEEKAHLDKLLQSETVIPSHSEWNEPADIAMQWLPTLQQTAHTMGKFEADVDDVLPIATRRITSIDNTDSHRTWIEGYSRMQLQ